MCAQICVETMMHLTCTNMPVEKLEEALTKVGCCLSVVTSCSAKHGSLQSCCCRAAESANSLMD